MFYNGFGIAAWNARNTKASRPNPCTRKLTPAPLAMQTLIICRGQSTETCKRGETGNEPRRTRRARRRVSQSYSGACPRRLLAQQRTFALRSVCPNRMWNTYGVRRFDRSNAPRCASRLWAVKMEHLRRSAGQADVSSKHMIRETRPSNLPNSGRWLSQLHPEFRTPKVFYPIAQGRAAHPGDRSHTHRPRTP